MGQPSLGVKRALPSPRQQRCASSCALHIDKSPAIVTMMGRPARSSRQHVQSPRWSTFCTFSIVSFLCMSLVSVLTTSRGAQAVDCHLLIGVPQLLRDKAGAQQVFSMSTVTVVMSVAYNAADAHHHSIILAPITHYMTEDSIYRSDTHCNRC
jgi:hypothetical protein